MTLLEDKKQDILEKKGNEATLDTDQGGSALRKRDRKTAAKAESKAKKASSKNLFKAA